MQSTMTTAAHRRSTRCAVATLCRRSQRVLIRDAAVSQLKPGTRVFVTGYKITKYNDARGTIIDADTASGRIPVKFDDAALGTKAMKLENVRIDGVEAADGGPDDDGKPSFSRELEATSKCPAFRRSAHAL